MAVPDTEQVRRPQGSMFDLMERLKVPVLWVCVVIMGGFGVWFLFQDLFPQGGRPPEVEEGSYEVPGGEKRSITNFGLADEAQKFSRVVHDRYGRADSSQIAQALLRVQARDEYELAWSYLILRDAAKAAGVVVTDEVFVNAAKKAGMETTLREYQRKASEDHREVSRDLESIRRFRNAVDEAQPEATFDKIYERFKTTYEDLKATFVLFDTSKTDVPLDATGNKEDREKLQKFMTENPGIGAQKRIPEELDASVLYVRFKDESTEKLQEQFNTRWKPLVEELKLEVSDEKLRARFDVFRSAWENEARNASEKWEKEHGGAASRTSQPDTRPTEFEFVKDRLRIEYLATRLVEKAFEEITRAEKPMSLEDAMAKYGLRLTEVKHLDSLHIQQHPDFPTPRGAEPMLRGLREKSLKPGDFYNYKGDSLVATGALEEPGGAVAIWKLTGYHPDREATLDDPGMLTFFTDEYKKKKRQDLAKEEAEAFRKAVEDKVTEQVATKVKELEAAMTLEIEKQIGDQKLDRNKPEDKPKILEIENGEKAKKDAAIDDEKAKVEPNMYQAVCLEKFLTVRDTGWIAKTSTRNASFAANDKLTPGEKADMFFRKPQRRAALAGLKVGRMGPVETEPNWYAAAVPILTERRAPTPDDLYHLSKSQLDTLKGQVSPRMQTQQFWNYESFKRPEWFNLNVPNIEKAIVDKREADAKSAEKKRIQDEKKKKATKAKAEKFADDAMKSRPLFSGEDW